MAGSDKLNKIAGVYHAARAISDNAKPKGSAEEMEEAVDSAAEEAKEKDKRSKKLNFTEGRGGLRTTIYDKSK